MTNRWSDLFEEPEHPSGVAFEGVYHCQLCEEKVYEAVYLPEQKILKWRCSNGHKSSIEEFDVG